MQPRRQPAEVAGARARRLLIYVEGPRDRDILRSWARRGWREVARAIDQDCVILGGKRPARAIDHFQSQPAPGAARALCILDRDDQGEHAGFDHLRHPAIDFFVWPRRHIESYLLDWSVIERSLRGRPRDPRLLDAARRLLPPPGDEEQLRRFDAKRLLSPRGPISELLGIDLRAGQIAKAMRQRDLHPDIAGLFERIRRGLGLPSEGPEVVVRAGGGR